MNRPLLLSRLTLLLALASSFAANAEPLTLDRAVQLALERNEQVKVAHNLTEQQQARLEKARAFFFPQLVAQGVYTRRAFQVERNIGGQNVVLQNQNALNGNLTASMPLFDATAIPLYRTALANVEAARYDEKNNVRLIGFQAADAFLQTLALNQVEAAAERRLELSKASLDDARARFEGKLVSSNDVTKAELDFANAQQALAAAKSDAERARLQLGYLLDIDAPKELVEPSDLQPTNRDPEALTQQAVTTRPDLMAWDARVRSARFFAQEPLMRLFPTLGIMGQARATNEPGFTGRVIDGFGALTLTWTIFDGGIRYADRHERLALLGIAELNKRQAQRQTATQVQTALVEIETAETQVHSASDAVTAAKKNADEVQELYKQGLATQLDATIARVSLFDSEVTLARTRYNVHIASLDLRSALGLDALGQASSDAGEKR